MVALNWNLQIKVNLKCEEISQQECCKSEVWLFGRVEMIWRSVKLNPSDLPNRTGNPLASECQRKVKNTRRASGTVPNVYLCSCKQQNSPLESVVWTRRKLSDLIIGQTHLLPVKTISCSSKSARVPVQTTEAANRFLPAASASGLKQRLWKHPEVLKSLAVPPTGLEWNQPSGFPEDEGVPHSRLFAGVSTWFDLNCF